MVKCRDCANLMKIFEVPKWRNPEYRVRGRCGPTKKIMHIDIERKCEDFTTERITDLFR